MFARSIAAVCLVFGLQAVPFAFEGQPAMNQTWAWIIGLALFSSLLLVTVAGATLGPTLPAAGALAAVYAAIIISDDGQGFDPNQNTDRLGVRTSILERTSNAAGTAHITSSPGNGTTIALT